MRGDPVPMGDHVTRHCRYTDLFIKDGKLVGITEAAFRPRPDENDELSVNWADFFTGNTQHRVECIRSITKLIAKGSHRIAFLRVGALIAAASPYSNLIVAQDPDDRLPPHTNAAHALIRPVADLGNVIVRERLASLVLVTDLYSFQ
jgi:hypothetical protein